MPQFMETIEKLDKTKETEINEARKLVRDIGANVEWEFAFCVAKVVNYARSLRINNHKIIRDARNAEKKARESLKKIIKYEKSSPSNPNELIDIVNFNKSEFEKVMN